MRLLYGMILTALNIFLVMDISWGDASQWTLQDCYQLASKRSETLAIRKEEIDKTTADFFKATSEALGDVDFIISDSRQQEGSGSSDSSVSSSFTDPRRHETKFTISQPLFQGFKSLGALQGVGSLRRQRKEEEARSREILFLDVADAFYTLLKLDGDIRIIEDIHHLFEERIADLAEREKIGRSRTSEIVTARSKMRSLEAELAKAKGERSVAEHTLEFLTGIPMTALELKDEVKTDENHETLDHYLPFAQRRSDVEAQKQAMETAWQGVIVAQSGLWPKITLESNVYGRREGFQSGIDWDLLFKTDVPLFRGGENIGKIKEAVVNFRQARLSYQLAERQARFEIQQAYENWIASENEWKAYRDALKDSDENFRLQKEDYAHQLVNNLDVLEALESFHQARRDTNQVYHEMKINHWKLKIAAGEMS